MPWRYSPRFFAPTAPAAGVINISERFASGGNSTAYITACAMRLDIHHALT